ncbi:MAG: hypothetical protein ETSY1_35955 [Candidatus Entotheonella factor]|uniref:DUF433 domain-containing protein n=1 Tax=Entotheonella factor TaxID=1429438 RepID=W4L819_ENTF1|nr:DUF433 domain-containing protein [Candidatus Entotheonella palauensis]ETW94182.1 MAG: hypothetical protein ETSY1_35955 [Candidatus Entotheonella factor]
MMLSATQVVPMTVDRDGVIRVGETRVRLATVIFAFNEGCTPEDIVSQYPTLRLADVYAVIAYYLNDKAEIDDYIATRKKIATTLRHELEATSDYQQFRERLLARRQTQLHQPNVSGEDVSETE